MKIGIRTIKTATGVSISVILAQALQLSYFTAAGLLTLLSIQRTRKQSLRTVSHRFFACLVGLAVASICFSLSQFRAWIFPVIFLVTIPLCVMLKIQEGVPSSSVVIMHAYIHEHVDLAFLLNELGIVVVGLGTGLLVNLYMPGIDRQIEQDKRQIERLISVILGHYAKHLRVGNLEWDGRELIELEDKLKAAQRLAEQDVENHPRRKDHHYYDYYRNKVGQFEILQRMLPLVSQIDPTLEQSVRIGELMDELSEDILHRRDTSGYNRRLRGIREYHKELPLPATRAEFESRACLFNLANELELLIEKVSADHERRVQAPG
jgi:uncharacterized membrane protein YgaE (UPF0421/DUF939 family)